MLAHFPGNCPNWQVPSMDAASASVSQAEMQNLTGPAIYGFSFHALIMSCWRHWGFVSAEGHSVTPSVSLKINRKNVGECKGSRNSQSEDKWCPVMAVMILKYARSQIIRNLILLWKNLLSYFPTSKTTADWCYLWANKLIEGSLNGGCTAFTIQVELGSLSRRKKKQIKRFSLL